jgi:hypothetical protein
MAKASAPRPKSTFMLHDPDNFSPLGKFVSTDYRYAALKCASRGHEQILLRKTNTKEIRKFEGKVVTLDSPKEITRGTPPRTIVYSKKPTVKFIGKSVYAGPPVDDEEVQTPDSRLPQPTV